MPFDKVGYTHFYFKKVVPWRKFDKVVLTESSIFEGKHSRFPVSSKFWLKMMPSNLT